MRGMKKVMALALTVCMAIGVVAVPAQAAVLPADVVNTPYESSAQTLANLNIMIGDEGGFRAEDTIKRSEFAKIAVMALGLENAAQTSTGISKFKDVETWHWANGYINIAASQGIVIGDDEGNFRPDDTINYAEALTILVRIAGYGPVLDVKGWPTNFIAKAIQVGIADGVSISDAFSGAIRGNIAKLTENTLDVPMLIQIGFGTNAAYVVSGTEGYTKETVLSQKLKLEVKEVEITSIDHSRRELRVKEKDSNGKYSIISKYTVPEAISIVGLENTFVNLWVDKDDVVRNIASDRTAASYFDYISAINGYNLDNNFTAVSKANLKDISLKNADTVYDVSSSATITLNNNEYTGTFGKDQLGYFVKVVVKDAEIVRIDMYTPERSGIVKNVTEDYIDFQVDTDTLSRIRGFADAPSLLVIIDGKIATLSDLEEGMYFTSRSFVSSKDSTKKDFVVVASSAEVTGMMNGLKEDKMRIDGTFYNRASTMYISTDGGKEFEMVTAEEDLNRLFNTNIQVKLNGNQEVVYIITNPDEDSNEFYGVVVGAWSSANDMLKVTKLGTDGEVESVYETAFDKPVASGKSSFSQIKSTFDTNSSEDAGDRIKNIYKFTLNSDGQIHEATYVNIASNSVITAKSFDAEAGRIISKTANSNIDVVNAVFFDLSNEEIKIYKWNDIKETSNSAVEDMTFVADATQAKVVVFMSNADGISGSEKFVGFINETSQIDKENMSYSISQGLEDLIATVEKSKNQNAKNDSIVIFQTLGNDKARIVASATYDSLNLLADPSVLKPVANTVTAATGGSADKVLGIKNKYVTVQTGLEGMNEFKVANDALIYEITDFGKANQDFEKTDLSAMSAGDDIYFLVREDIIRAIFFVGSK